MPEAFEKCVRNKGRVRTVSGPSKEHGLSENEYQKFCYINNEGFAGEIHTKKTETAK